MWISKNPHLPGDRDPNVDYFKVFLWNTPPKVVRGSLTLNKDGSYTYFGNFVTADAPGGKPADQLDDEDKKQLLKRFAEEKIAVDAFHKKLQEEEEKNKTLKSEIGRGCFDATLLPLHLALRAPEHVSTGLPATLSATGTTATESISQLEHYLWDLGDGGKTRSTSPTVVYKTSGTYTITLTAVDRFGSIGEATKKIVVGPATGMSPAKLVEVQPQVGTGNGTDAGVYAPPISSNPTELMTVSVESEQQTGPTEFYVQTVDGQDRKKILRGITDRYGHALLSLGKGIVAAMLFKSFDRNGQPDQGATCRFGRQSQQLIGSEELNSPPNTGSAILRANSSIEIGGRGNGITNWQTRGSTPDAQMRVDGSSANITTLAASDMSMVGKVQATLAVGAHQFDFVTPGGVSNAFHADVVTLQFKPLPKLRPGQVTSVEVSIGGIAPQHAAVVKFSVGGAAVIVGGASSATVPVVNGGASISIQAVRSGDLSISIELQVSSSDFKSRP